ncbi:MAG: hypothetical protein JWP89_5657 [Schlesneria sp.]|nr:hypothetical protein [Schlesneria sp.]
MLGWPDSCDKRLSAVNYAGRISRPRHSVSSFVEDRSLPWRSYDDCVVYPLWHVGSTLTPLSIGLFRLSPDTTWEAEGEGLKGKGRSEGSYAVLLRFRHTPPGC